MSDRKQPTGRPDQSAGSRAAEVQDLLDDAEARDELAEVRDSDATERDGAAALASFLDPDSDYDAVLRTRRSAALDRTASKGDRASAADDRSKLASDHKPAESQDEG